MTIVLIDRADHGRDTALLLGLGDTGGVAKRNLLRILRTPRLLVIGTLQPAMLLLLFRYVLGGAIRIPGHLRRLRGPRCLHRGRPDRRHDHRDRARRGSPERDHRSVPKPAHGPLAVLAGRTLADLPQRPVAGHHDRPRARRRVPLPQLVSAILAGIALILIFGYAFSWMYATIGLATKDPETAQVAGILPFFILMFASNAIVPLATMPGWLQPFARNQPLSLTVTSVRALLDGGPAAHWVWQTMAWSIAIFTVFFFISLRLYHRANF